MKKQYLTDKEEPTYDIRKVFLNVIDNIQIIGDISKIMSEKQFNALMKNNKIAEYGYDGEVQCIKLQYIFSLEDVKNKIEKICGGE